MNESGYSVHFIDNLHTNNNKITGTSPSELVCHFQSETCKGRLLHTISYNPSLPHSHTPSPVILCPNILQHLYLYALIPGFNKSTTFSRIDKCSTSWISSKKKEIVQGGITTHCALHRSRFLGGKGRYVT